MSHVGQDLPAQRLLTLEAQTTSPWAWQAWRARFQNHYDVASLPALDVQAVRDSLPRLPSMLQQWVQPGLVSQPTRAMRTDTLRDTWLAVERIATTYHGTRHNLHVWRRDLRVLTAALAVLVLANAVALLLVLLAMPSDDVGARIAAWLGLGLLGLLTYSIGSVVAAQYTAVHGALAARYAQVLQYETTVESRPFYLKMLVAQPDVARLVADFASWPPSYAGYVWPALFRRTAAVRSPAMVVPPRPAEARAYTRQLADAVTDVARRTSDRLTAVTADVNDAGLQTRYRTALVLMACSPSGDEEEEEEEERTDADAALQTLV